MIIVPDTSVVIDGRITQLVKRKYKHAKVVIPEAVVAELEHQANRGKESGFKGLEELELLRKYADKGIIELEYLGKRPKVSELKDVDDIIRNTAKEVEGCLITSDRIQYRVAKNKGIEVIYLKKKKIEKRLTILKFFDDETMSVHLKEKVPPIAKRGKPGEIKLVRLSEEPITEKELKKIGREIIEFARVDPDSFIEIERKGATVIQLKQLRIAIARPPFSDGLEITAVRPIANVNLEDYALSEKLMERLRRRAEGILVAGPPGAGKSTFSQALAEFYKSQGKIVKTMESPRDLIVSDEITQYAPLEGDMEKTADILLLVRPDYTIYDELRKTRDFRIFADMRLAGVGMVGVVHATKAIDAIQRLIGRVELGMIPQIADTIIFIKDGEIAKVYKVTFTVKVPEGMTESDLARPIIEVKDFETDAIEYEIYTFGEETIVMPVLKKEVRPVERLARERIIQELRKLVPKAKIDVEVKNSKAIVWIGEKYIPRIIGKKGKKIEKLEGVLNISIDVRALEEKTENKIDIRISETENYLLLQLDKKLSGKMIKVFADDVYLFTATIGRKGEIKVGKKTNIGHWLGEYLAAGKEIYAIEE